MASRGRENQEVDIRTMEISLVRRATETQKVNEGCCGEAVGEENCGEGG